jgi:formamidopyrimidine-DNA glycosylase
LPELPEVETIRRGLEAGVRGRRVVKVAVLSPRAVGGAAQCFAAALAGERVASLGRRGKYLLFGLDGGGAMVGHLRMTGRLRLVRAGDPVAPHTRLVWSLSGGRELRFEDVRQFGRFWYVAPGEDLPRGLRELGPEPLGEEFRAEHLARRLVGRRAPLKALLLDQRVVAGLGNIYVDEALFRARLAPTRPAGGLAAEELERLCAAIRHVLEDALRRGGTTLRDYQDARGRPGGYGECLMVYGRQGQPCRACGAEVVKVRVAGRGTHLCPRCQGEEEERALLDAAVSVPRGGRGGPRVAVEPAQGDRRGRAAHGEG